LLDSRPFLSRSRPYPHGFPPATPPSYPSTVEASFTQGVLLFPAFPQSFLLTINKSLPSFGKEFPPGGTEGHTSSSSALIFYCCFHVCFYRLKSPSQIGTTFFSFGRRLVAVPPSIVLSPFNPDLDRLVAAFFSFPRAPCQDPQSHCRFFFATPPPKYQLYFFFPSSLFQDRVVVLFFFLSSCSIHQNPPFIRFCSFSPPTPHPKTHTQTPLPPKKNPNPRHPLLFFSDLWT